MSQDSPEAGFHRPPNPGERLKQGSTGKRTRQLGEAGIVHATNSYPPDSNGMAYWGEPPAKVFACRDGATGYNDDGTIKYVVL